MLIKYIFNLYLNKDAFFLHVTAGLNENDKSIIRETFKSDAANMIIQNDLISRVAEFMQAHYSVLEVLDVPDIKEVVY